MESIEERSLPYTQAKIRRDQTRSKSSHLGYGKELVSTLCRTEEMENGNSDLFESRRSAIMRLVTSESHACLGC